MVVRGFAGLTMLAMIVAAGTNGAVAEWSATVAYGAIVLTAIAAIVGTLRSGSPDVRQPKPLPKGAVDWDVSQREVLVSKDGPGVQTVQPSQSSTQHDAVT